MIVNVKDVEYFEFIEKEPRVCLKVSVRDNKFNSFFE